MSDGCTVPKPLLWLLDGAEEFYAAIRDEACAPHDQDYNRGGTELDRLLADLRLHLNALVAARRHLAGWTEADIMLCARRTYQAVRIGGASHWRYPDGYVAPSGFEDDPALESA